MGEAARLHEEQVAYWSGPGGERWVRGHRRSEAMMVGIADIALDRAAARAGESVVDIGCGCGATTVALAERVGPAGHVLALDVSAPILAAARERLGGLPQVETVLADAASHEFRPASADLLFSRFGVMFFGDPTAAFGNLRRALKPGGRLAFACWRQPRENPWMMTPLEAVRRHAPAPPRPGPEEPGPFSFADQARVARILTAAGFGPVEFEPLDLMVDLASGQGLEAAVETALGVGPSARALEDQPDQVRAAAAVDLRKTLSAYLVGRSVRLAAAVWLVRAGGAAERA